MPARLDRLPWSPWHTRLVVALGVTWMLDGLEVTLVGAVGPVLREPATLHLTDAQIGATASAYLAGAIVGALVFGRLTDSYGRKKLFLVTLSVYLAATLATGASWSFASFAFFRAVTGAGIGGEYAAVNSAIDELLPARVRGRADLAINGTYWLGTIVGALMSLLMLNPRILPPSLGWRLVFLAGAVLGLSILLIRRHVPESPRWLLLHGRIAAADRVVRVIEEEVERENHEKLPAECEKRALEAKGSVSFSAIARVLFQHHRRRAVLGLVLMTAQAFAYNGVFFTYALVLSNFFGVPSSRVGLYLLPFAAGNMLGPVLLGPLFDRIGRRAMIGGTYAVSGLLILATAWGITSGALTATSLTALWCAVFFVASAAASSAYLTVSELFPVELRGMVIALFYAVGTAVGGLSAPTVFGALLERGPSAVALGYAFGAALMIAAGIVAAIIGVPAEGRSLESLRSLPDVK